MKASIMRRHRIGIVPAVSSAALVFLCIFIGCGRRSAAPPEKTNLVFPNERSGEMTIVFAGDYMMHTSQITGAATAGGTYDFRYSLERMKPLWSGADLSVINYETTVSRSAFSGYPRFSAPVQALEALKDAGMKVVALANNHICDYGQKGLSETIAAADSLGMLRTGAYRDSAEYRKMCPLFIESGGVKAALLNYTYGTNGLPVPDGMVVPHIDTAVIAKDLVRAAGADIRIVFFHWGAEYSLVPSAGQVRLAEMCRRYGADLVIGSHPHVVQPADYIRRADSTLSAATFYSLGNFISNQRDRYCDGGINVKITAVLLDTGEVEFSTEIIPVWVWRYRENGRRKYLAIPEPMEDRPELSEADRWRHQRFLDDLSAILKK